MIRPLDPAKPDGQFVIHARDLRVGDVLGEYRIHDIEPTGLLVLVTFDDGEAITYALDDELQIHDRARPERFGTLYADPNWSFRDKGSRIAPDSTRSDDQPSAGYSTDSLATICALPVRELARPDAVLFLWSTWTHLLDGSAAKVAHAWGFADLVVGIPWVKLSAGASASRAAHASHPACSLAYRTGLRLQIGAGHYVRAISEVLVICKRDRTPTVEACDRLPGVILAPRPGGHSAKPPAARAMIETLYPDHGPRLELFARGRLAPGWHGYGFEAEGDLVLPRLTPPPPSA